MSRWGSSAPTIITWLDEDALHVLDARFSYASESGQVRPAWLVALWASNGYFF